MNISKRKAIIFFTSFIVIILVIGFLFYMFITREQRALDDILPEEVEELPFDFLPEREIDSSIRRGDEVLFQDDENNNKRIIEQINIGGEDIVIEEGERLSLVQLFDRPVSGFTIENISIEEVTIGSGETEEVIQVENSVVKLVDRESGNIYQIKLEPIGGVLSRISNTRFPRIIDAYLGSNDTLAFLFEDIENEGVINTFFGRLVDGENDFKIITGSQVDGEAFISNDETTSTFFYINKNNSDGSDAIVFNIGNQTRTRVYTSPLSIWLPVLWGNGDVSVYTRPSYDSVGLLFHIDRNTGDTRLSPASFFGLSISPFGNGRNGVISVVSDDELFTGILNENDETEFFSFKTFAEKCSGNQSEIICGVPKNSSLNNRNRLPDLWYTGEVSFDDAFAIYDIGTQESILLELETDELFDVIKPALSPLGRYFVFINKYDNTLWAIYR